MLEVYAKIEGYPNYAISNHGEVINIKKKNDKPLDKRDNGRGYLRVALSLNGKRKYLYVHKLVANAYLDKIENKKLVDHIDGNSLNNRLDNLRFCNNSENMRNRVISKNNTTGVKGVIFSKQMNKWQASIRINKKLYHLGFFDNIEQASVARKNKARETFGEFLNDADK